MQIIQEGWAKWADAAGGGQHAVPGVWVRIAVRPMGLGLELYAVTKTPPVSQCASDYISSRSAGDGGVS